MTTTTVLFLALLLAPPSQPLDGPDARADQDNLREPPKRAKQKFDYRQVVDTKNQKSWTTTAGNREFRITWSAARPKDYLAIERVKNKQVSKTVPIGKYRSLDDAQLAIETFLTPGQLQWKLHATDADKKEWRDASGMYGIVKPTGSMEYFLYIGIPPTHPVAPDQSFRSFEEAADVFERIRPESPSSIESVLKGMIQQGRESVRGTPFEKRRQP